VTAAAPGSEGSGTQASAADPIDPTTGTTTTAADSTGGAATQGATTQGATTQDTTTGVGPSGATTTTGTSSSTSDADDDGSSSTGDAPSDPPPVPFLTDVTTDAGVEYVQGVFNSSPNCLVDQIGSGKNGFCSPERMMAGAAVGDVDGDGWDDLFVTRTADTDILFHNEGDGTFTDVTAASGIDVVAHSSAAAFADVDNDGDLDLYVTSIASYRYDLWINDGAGGFVEDAVARGAAIETADVHVGMSVAVGDYDLDGYVDLYVGEWRTVGGLGDVPSHSRLLHNLGAAAPGHFEDATNAANVNVDGVWTESGLDLAGTYTFAPAFVDLDNDRHPELALASDFETSRLFWNLGDGTFLDGTLAAGTGSEQNGMGSAFGDYDNDGDLDWYVTAITDVGEADQNRLYRNTGARAFQTFETLHAVGDNGWGWGAVFFDANNDGHLDLVAANGYYFTTHLDDIMKLWRNQGGGPFVDVSIPSGIVESRQRRGVLTFDYDHDGDLDLFVTVNCGVPELFRNENGNEGDWLRVRVAGTTSNREGIGARVSMRVHDDAPTQLREIGAASHYMGQSERIAHFGVGPGDATIAEVRVYWPVTDQEQVFVDVARNSELVVEEP
jgi:hypothetical protein